jgi:hypothetical protein
MSLDFALMTNNGASSAVVSHSSQKRLEWGTQPSLPVKHAGLCSPNSHRISKKSCHPERSRGICSFPSLNTAGCPIQARFWLEWDTTALDRSPSPFGAVYTGTVRLCTARRRATRASSRVESSVGSGEFASFISSGISVQPSTTASQPSSFMRSITR